MTFTALGTLYEEELLSDRRIDLFSGPPSGQARLPVRKCSRTSCKQIQDFKYDVVGKIIMTKYIDHGKAIPDTHCKIRPGIKTFATIAIIRARLLHQKNNLKQTNAWIRSLCNIIVELLSLREFRRPTFLKH